MRWVGSTASVGVVADVTLQRTINLYARNAYSKSIGPNLEIKLKAPVLFTVLLCRHSGAALAKVRLTKVHC